MHSVTKKWQAKCQGHLSEEELFPILYLQLQLLLMRTIKLDLVTKKLEEEERKKAIDKFLQVELLLKHLNTQNMHFKWHQQQQQQ